MSHFRPDNNDSEIMFRSHETEENDPQTLLSENRAPTLQPVEDEMLSSISRSRSVVQAVASVGSGRNFETRDREALQEMSRLTCNLAGAVTRLVENLGNNPRPAYTSMDSNPQPCGSVQRDGNEIERETDRIDQDRIENSQQQSNMNDCRMQLPYDNCNLSNNLRGDGIAASNQRRPHMQYNERHSGPAQYGAAHENNWLLPPDAVNGYNPNNRKMSGPVKIPAFTGKEDFITWITRFETIARRYNWSMDDKLDNLLPRIEGQAAEFVFSQLPSHILDDYRELVREMQSRYRVVESARSFAVQFSRRSQRFGESIEEYAADLKRLYDKAHGYRDRICREEDLVRRFLDGLSDEDVKFEVEFHKEPRTIDEAVLHAANMIQMRGSNEPDKRYRKGTRRMLEEPFDGQGNITQYDQEMPRDSPVYRIQDKRDANTLNRQGAQRDSSIQKEADDKSRSEMVLMQIMENQEKMLTRIEALEKRQNSSQPRKGTGRNIECFNCHEMGHIARECTKERGDSRNRFNRNPRRWQQEEKTENKQALNWKGPALSAEGRSN